MSNRWETQMVYRAWACNSSATKFLELHSSGAPDNLMYASRVHLRGTLTPESPQQGGPMKRREFLHRTACAAGAAWIHPAAFVRPPFALPALSRKFSAADTVTFGKTGIQTSRLAMGTGTVGSGHHSHQTALGVKGLSDLLLNGYDHGLRFFDAADSY